MELQALSEECKRVLRKATSERNPLELRCGLSALKDAKGKDVTYTVDVLDGAPREKANLVEYGYMMRTVGGINTQVRTSDTEM